MANGWGRRWRTVYAFDVRFPFKTRPQRVGYVGKTSSALHFRASQHDSKRWMRYVVPTPLGGMYVVWEGECGRIVFWFREVYYIHKLKPLFNIRHNEGNPDRVLPWEY